MKEIAEQLKQKQRVVLLTGAGMSTECGIPDFRSTGGYWDGKKYEDILKTQSTGTKAFREFVIRLIKDVENGVKHEGYAILERWQQAGIVQHVITQNVDGYHYEPIEYHGGLHHYYCEECDAPSTKQAFLENAVCPVCKLDMMIRPDMVLYGEKIPYDVEKIAEKMVQEADLLLVMGTTLTVQPFAGLVSLYLSKPADKKPLWIVNQTDTPFTKFATYTSHEPIAEWFQKMDRYID